MKKEYLVQLSIRKPGAEHISMQKSGVQKIIIGILGRSAGLRIERFAKFI